MSSVPESTGPESTVRNYDLLCVTAVVILFLALFLRGFGWWSVLVLLVGLLGHLFRWRLAPLLLLVTLTLPQLSFLFVRVYVAFNPQTASSSRWWRLPRLQESDFLSNWILCTAVLGYVAAHYRVQGLLSHVFPPDARLPRAMRVLRQAQARRRGSPAAAAVPHATPASLGLPGRFLQRRSAPVAGSSELLLLLLSVPVWASLAGIGWELLLSAEPGLGFEPELWRGMVLVWIVGLGLLAATSVLGYLAWVRMSPAEAALFLQDVMWRETRREQTRISRWIAWARIKKPPRKDKT